MKRTKHAFCLVTIICLVNCPVVSAPALALEALGVAPGEAPLVSLAAAAEGQETIAEAMPAFPEGLLEALQALKPDPLPQKYSNDFHFVYSDEKRHYLFQEAATDLGGVLLGVGPEQNYLLAGWARPTLMVLMDFDQVVVNLHAAYRVAFEVTDNPAAFVELWNPKNAKQFQKHLQAFYKDDSLRRKQATAVHQRAHKAVYWRLKRIVNAYTAEGKLCFLNDQEQFGFVATLVRSNRAVALRGDLTKKGTLQGIAEVLSRYGQTVRLAYLSNAEQYFVFSPQFKANMQGLPTDEKSLLLRTRPTGQDYTYVVQSYPLFLSWLAAAHVKNVRQMVPRKKLSPASPLLVLEQGPPPAPPPKAKKKTKTASKPVEAENPSDDASAE